MTIIYLILAALALGVLVFIHELGHFFAARSVGMIVEAFSIGFGPSLFKWRSKNGVEWRIGIIPLGGYVRIAGMDFKKRKKEEESSGCELINPYDIKNGFYSKSPLKRIYVLIAGPLANVIFAMLVFCAIWFLGGRDKSFSELTQVVGWVSPGSEFYKAGLRKGDRIFSCNGKHYEGIKDILYASILDGSRMTLTGERYDFATNKASPFSIIVQPRNNTLSQSTLTVPFSSARYLIYAMTKSQENKLPMGSPMLDSGVAYGDRLVWMDGELLFSLDQMSALLNEQYALLTIKRNDHIFLSRQPRILAGEMSLPIYLRNDLIDCQYEAYLKGKWSSLYILPYVIGNNCYIEKLLPLSTGLLDELKINKDSYSDLQVGDLILAVDGQVVYSNYEILKLIQNHQALIIVKRNLDEVTHLSDYGVQEDSNFLKSFDFSQIEKIASSIGSDDVNKEAGKFVLLNPVTPRRWDQFHVSKENKDKFLEEMERQKQLINTIKNKAKKVALLEQLEESKKRVMLGIHLQDLIVKYNPNPFELFLSTFSETARTLKGLISGRVNVKWLSGPVGIVQALHHGWSLGINEALFWIGLISVNLAVLNLLPIPVLDGGYVVFSLWEWISGKRLNLRLIEKLIIPFIILLVLLFILLTFQDILRLL